MNAESDTARAPDMPVTLTTRARASASTASWTRQPLALEKRAAPQSADAATTGSGSLMTARALVEEAEGQELVTEGRMFEEVVASRSHVSDTLELSMHTVPLAEMVGREEKVDPKQTGAHVVHGPALTNELRHCVSEMKGFTVPTLLQSSPNAPAAHAHSAVNPLELDPFVQ